MGKMEQIFKDFVGANEREVPEVPETTEETKSEIQKMNENLGKMVDILMAKAKAEVTETKADTVEAEKADAPEAKEPETETVEAKEPETETVEVKEPETETVEVKEPDAVEEVIEPEIIESETIEPEVIEPEATEKSEVDKAKIAAGNVEEAIKANSEIVEGKETETETVEVKEPDAVEETVEPEIAEPRSDPEPTEANADQESESRRPIRGKELKVPEFLIEARMQSRRFYDELGDKAYKFDSAGEMSKDLEAYVFDILDRRPDLVDKVVGQNLEQYISRNQAEIPRIDRTISRISDKNIEIGLRYVHTTKNHETYDTWDEAVDSMKEVTESYGLKPEDYFVKQYYRLDQPEKEIPEDEVRKYISSFRGNRKKLYKKLQVEPKKQN